MDKDVAYREALKMIKEARREGTTTLDFSGMGLTTLAPEIGQLTALEKLHLVGNDLSSLPPEISHLTALKELNLSLNQFSSLPPEIGQLKVLKSLGLSANQLSTLPAEIVQLTLLRELYLDNNRLSTLPAEVGQLTSLKELLLNKNQLSTLPPEIGQLTMLTKLDLQENQISALPPEIGQLTALTEMRLDNNHLSTLPPEIGQLTALTKLQISNNRLSSLPPEIGQLTALTTLVMEINQFSKLPPEIGRLTSLTEWWLYGNQISTLPPAIGQLTSLTDLSLSRNQISNLPPEIGQLVALKKLSISYNQLLSLPAEIGHLAALEGLDLGGNRSLAKLPPEIGKLTSLKALHAGATGISDLPPELFQLTSLEELWLDQNNLASLPGEFRRLTSLKALYLHGNKSLNIPPEILGPDSRKVRREKLTPADPQSILNYYFRPKRPLNEAKLIFVGFGKVGKTSLVKRLVDGTFDKDEKKTEGIRITQWPVTLPDIQDKVLLHVWDFGGQEIMHSTHQFFLSHRSLYLLVLNGRQGHEDTDAEYWLNLIHSFGSDSRVIVVLNKQKEHPFDLNRHNLQDKFPGMIQCFIKTECDNPAQGIAELHEAILRETKRLEGLHDGFPEEWFAIKNELAAMKENYLTFEQYRVLCSRLGEKAQMDQDRLAGYLHQLGVALNYKEDPRLRDMHILNPHWVTEGIYTILNAKQLEERKGELHIDYLSQILDPKNYPRERHFFLLNLMRRGYLCFEFPDKEGHYLVPDLADKNQPSQATDFDPKQCLNFQYSYPSLHEGVLPSFITRTYILSEKHPRWRTGVILEFEGCRALVKGDLTERLVSISVTGKPPEARRRLLAVIRSSFEDIHSNFKFKPEELVPVPGHPEVAIPYAKLLVLEKNNIKTIQEVAGDSVLELNVLALLNGVDLEGERRPREEKREIEPRGVKLFYSYSHKDEAMREELETHLKILQRQGLIEPWHDRRIVAGEDWRKEIDKHLEEADIILLLVSAPFVASDYCYDIEVKRAMKRYDAGEAQVIPIILCQSNWEGTPFGKIQALPKDAKPVEKHRPKSTAWTQISKALEKIARDLKNKRPDV